MNVRKDYWFIARFCYGGSWRFVDLLTLQAGALALKLVLDSASKGNLLSVVHGRQCLFLKGQCHEIFLNFLFHELKPSFP